MKSYEQLQTFLRENAKLHQLASLLEWDQQVNLPPNGAAARGEAAALVASLQHQKATEPQLLRAVDQLAAKLSSLSRDQAVTVHELKRDLDMLRKLPQAHVAKSSQLSAQGFAAWHEAKQKADFAIFAPVLKELVKLKRAEAKLLGYKDYPYDALLDEYEPGLTVAKLEPLFAELKDFLVGFLQRHRWPKPPRAFTKPVDAMTQRALSVEVVTAMGYDWAGGRLDASPHPFTDGIAVGDVRITTSFLPEEPLFSLESSMHEAGHALYEQGLPAKFYGQPLGQAVSLGVHESQSRLWENQVGKSRAFAAWLWPLMQQHYGRAFKLSNAEALYRALNHVEPSLIRVQADEVTYNLHIILRYELEKQLIAGELTVDELPTAWNRAMREYLGVKVPDDARGVLQDVHWSSGLFGYFPTYALGNIYAAQLMAAARRQLPRLDSSFRRGQFSPLRDWLRANVHRHGRRFSPDELIKKATGELPNAQYFIDYIGTKFEPLAEPVKFV